MVKRLEYRAVPVVALVLIALVFFLGIRSERTGFVDEVLDPNLKRITHPVLNAFRGKPPVISQMEINLDDAQKDSLDAIEDLALANGWLDPQDNAWIPATVEWNGSSYSSHIRPQEGPVDLDAVPRWPFSIALGSTDSTGHARRMDLFPVSDALPLYGALFQAAMRQEGIPVLSKELVELRVANKDIGPYVLETQGDSLQVAAWGRGNGPVIRFDDVLHKHALHRIDALKYPVETPLGSEWLSAPLASNAKYIGATRPPLEPMQRKALEDLERFRAGKLKTSDVFDAVSLGKFLALCDVMGAQSSADWWNLRFLLDSTTQRFIVFPRHTIAGRPITGIIARHAQRVPGDPSASTSLANRFLADPVVYATYIAALSEYSSPSWSAQLLETHAEEMDSLGRIVRSTYRDAVLDPSIMTHCREVVDLMLHPHEPALAYIRFMRGKRCVVSVANVHDLPIVIRGFIDQNDTIPRGIPIVIPPREPNKPLTYVRVELETPRDSLFKPSLLVSVFGADERIAVRMRSSTMFVGNTETTVP